MMTATASTAARGALAALVLATMAVTAACGGAGTASGPAAGDTATNAPAPNPGPSATQPTVVAGDPEARACTGGASYQVILESLVDGEPVSFQVLEPSSCEGKSALILEGHGYGGSRSTSGFEFLRDNGYGVISIDQRGHGDSGGTVRTMDPEFEGQDLIRIVDWAQTQLDWVEFRDAAGNVVAADAPGANLALGAIGGSYGGGFQLLLLAIDPLQRLDAIVPEITWHDLTYSLNPGDTVKSGWGAILSAGGESGNQGDTDPFIRSTLGEAVLTNRFPEPSLDFFHYHSPSYYCDNERGLAVGDDGDTGGYTFDTVGGLTPLAGGSFEIRTPAVRQPPVDALIFQGFRDTLFNVNEAVDNYECLRANGGDVRLYTYQSGHNILFPGAGASFQAIELQSPLPDSACGAVNVQDATLAWFDDKIRGLGNADDVIDPDATGQPVCVSLATGDALFFDAMPRGGAEFTIGQQGVPNDTMPHIVPLGPAGARPIVQQFGVFPTANDVLVAGIPTATITVGAPADAPLPEDTDSIVFIGLGHQRLETPNVWDLVDNQLIPLRGFGTFEVDLVAVAERLQPGDDLALLMYGFHEQYPSSATRDPAAAAVAVSGTVRIPLFEGDGSDSLFGGGG